MGALARKTSSMSVNAGAIDSNRSTAGHSCYFTSDDLRFMDCTSLLTPAPVKASILYIMRAPRTQ